MTDVATLVLVLCAFYLHDCSLWIERDTVVFLARWTRRWRPVFPHPLFSGARKGLLLSFRLPPLTPVYLAYPWRIALSPTHVAQFPPLDSPVETKDNPVSSAMAWSTIRSVDTMEDAVRVNGQAVIACQTQDRAAATAALLQDLLSCGPADRAEAVMKALTRSLDVAALRKLLAKLTSEGARLRVLCNLLFVYLFIVAPTLMLLLSLARLWAPLLALLVVLIIAIASEFWRVHRRIWPADRSERRSALVHLCLYPPAAIRTYDALAHRLCAPYHPVAVAVVLCDAPVRDRFLRRALLDLRFPATRAVVGETADDPQTWFRTALETRIHRLLADQGLEPATYLDPPAQMDPSSLSYCPRCEVEYALLAGTCSDCVGVSLVQFGAARDTANGSRVTVG